MPTKRRTLPTLPVAAGGAARIEEEPRLPAEAEAARIKADDDGDNDDDDGGNASSTSSDPYTCDDETGERILKPGRTALIDAEAEETRSQRKMETWTELEVIAWLTEQSFEGLVIQNFANERIGGKVLSTLKTEELEQLGVTSPLHQKKVCSAIKKERARLQRVAERHLVEAWSAKDVQKWLEIGPQGLGPVLNRFSYVVCVSFRSAFQLSLPAADAHGSFAPLFFLCPPLFINFYI